VLEFTWYVPAWSVFDNPESLRHLLADVCPAAMPTRFGPGDPPA
jgi:hypothetical protein